MYILERALTIDEKIRRAEEIYQRRQEQNNKRTYATVSVNDRDRGNGKSSGNKTIKKMILQIAICFVIYFIYYLIQNSNYIFSEGVINNTKEILSYNIDFSQYYEQFMGLFNNESEESNGKGDTKNSTDESTKDNSEDTSIENDLQNGIGGSNEVLIVEGGTVEVTEPEKAQIDTSNLSQMEIDAINIKDAVSIISPLQGVITSRFGLRDPSTPVVPKNHTGLDIAANTGTVITAAMDGTVILVSSEGDYGNHIKVLNGDVMNVYAHCSNIYVVEGQEIKQGEAIAEVGATGNTTGPHLHFEIRKENRFVDPEYILGAM